MQYFKVQTNQEAKFQLPLKETKENSPKFQMYEDPILSKEILNYFLCPICNSILNVPKQCCNNNCNIAFCEKCIEKYSNCPICKINKKTTKLHFILKKILNNLEIQCKICFQIGKYKNINSFHKCVIKKIEFCDDSTDLNNSCILGEIDNIDNLLGSVKNNFNEIFDENNKKNYNFYEKSYTDKNVFVKYNLYEKSDFEEDFINTNNFANKKDNVVFAKNDNENNLINNNLIVKENYNDDSNSFNDIYHIENFPKKNVFNKTKKKNISELNNYNKMDKNSFENFPTKSVLVKNKEKNIEKKNIDSFKNVEKESYSSNVRVRENLETPLSKTKKMMQKFKKYKNAPSNSFPIKSTKFEYDYTPESNKLKSPYEIVDSILKLSQEIDKVEEKCNISHNFFEKIIDNSQNDNYVSGEENIYVSVDNNMPNLKNFNMNNFNNVKSLERSNKPTIFK